MEYCKNIRMFVITHKFVPNIYGSERELLQVGANHIKTNINLKDSSKPDNIANKNAFYCELTGLYYIWKNVTCNIVSFEHYRRLFSKRKIYFLKFPFINKKNISKILNSYGWILPRRYLEDTTIEEQYAKNHFIDDLSVVRTILYENFPEYIATFDKVMKSNTMYYYNMFVTTKDNLNCYCEWLFKILNILENRIDYINRDTYQQRVFGFLSERLLNVYIEYNKFKVYECNVEFIQNTKPIKNFMKKVCNKLG